MSLQALSFGGLANRQDDNLIPIISALTATDCYVDEDTIKGRSGYRDALNGTAVGSSSQLVQGIWRFKPTESTQKTVVVVAGAIYLITDPSTDSLSDGVLGTSLGTVFGTTANISGVQLGSNFYLASDESNVAARRINSSFTLESIETIATPAKPSSSVTAATWFNYRAQVTGGGCSVTASNCAWWTTATDLLATWYAIAGTSSATSQPTTGATATVTLTTAQDIRGADWLLVAVAPPDTKYGKKGVTIEISSDGSTWIQIGYINDDTNPPAGSPNLIFCDIRSVVSDTVKSAFKYIRFTVDNIADPLTQLRYAVYGHCVLFGRGAVDENPRKYYVDIYNPSTGQSSVLSEEVEVTITDDNARPPAYTHQYMIDAHYGYRNGTLGPLDKSNQRNYNLTKPLAYPDISELGAKVTISGTTPTYSGTMTVRLWLIASNGAKRLVASKTSVSAATAYSLVDSGSREVLANEAYKAGGILPRTTALTAYAGRIVAGYLNRLYISSFTATSDTSNPMPQFPDIATETADGWSYDIAPGSDEQIIGLDGTGDCLYILTNKAVYSMSDIEPNSRPYMVLRCGCISRRGYKYAEDRLFWLSWDGVYQAANRSASSELSFSIRRLYQDTLAPDSNSCIDYDKVTRSILIFKDTKVLRYCFATVEGSEWTGPHTLAHTIRHTASWFEKGGTPQLWLFTSDRRVGRWQKAVHRDLQVGTDTTTGTALPSWVFSTGFQKLPTPGRVKGLLVDSTGDCTVTVAKTVAGTSPAQGRSLLVSTKEGMDEVYEAAFGDLRGHKFRIQFSAANTVTVRSAMWDVELLDAKGG